MENILQASILVDFLYPFLLMFFLMFAILQKTKLFGDNKSQLDSMVSMIVSVIFVSVAGYVDLASDLILFMVIGVVIIFVGYVLLGFLGGGEIKLGLGSSFGKFVISAVFIGIFIAILASLGIAESFFEGLQKLFDWVFNSSWSGGFWTNVIVILIVVAAVWGVWKTTSSGD